MVDLADALVPLRYPRPSITQDDTPAPVPQVIEPLGKPTTDDTPADIVVDSAAPVSEGTLPLASTTAEPTPTPAIEAAEEGKADEVAKVEDTPAAETTETVPAETTSTPTTPPKKTKDDKERKKEKKLSIVGGLTGLFRSVSPSKSKVSRNPS